QFADCTSTRSPLATPNSPRSAEAMASTRASISRHVQLRSPQTKPGASGSRRAACVRKCARFITRVLAGRKAPAAAFMPGAPPDGLRSSCWSPFRIPRALAAGGKHLAELGLDQARLLDQALRQLGLPRLVHAAVDGGDAERAGEPALRRAQR